MNMNIPTAYFDRAFVALILNTISILKLTTTVTLNILINTYKSYVYYGVLTSYYIKNYVML